MNMMEELFVGILEMSITVFPVILAVLALRLALWKVPKIFSYLLWMVVLVRLLCPVVLKADFGILPDYTDFIVIGMPPERIIENVNITDGGAESEIQVDHTYIEYHYEIDSNVWEGGVPGTDSNMGQHEYGRMAYSRRVQLPLAAVRLMMIVWSVVAAGLLAYEGISYVFFMKRVREKGAQTPFTAGIFRPQIYLPEELDETQRELVTEHEKMHIKRLDYLVKPIFFLVCCIHWFNPLVWLAFYLMESDMESSCDEAVLHRLGYHRRKDYAYTLLALCEDGGWKLGYPIAFGERNIKNRIKDAAIAKKAPVWVIGVAAAVVAAAAVVLMVNRSEETQEYLPETTVYLPDEEIVRNEEEERYSLPSEGITVTFNGNMVGETDHKYYVAEDASSSVSLEEKSDGSGEHREELPLEENVEYEWISYSGDEKFDTTDMDYDPARERDMYQVLVLPNPESYEDVEILLSVPIEIIDIRDDYGTRTNPLTGETLYHSGIDFVAEEGTPVLAAADGTVAQTGWDAGCGNYIIIAHKNGIFTYYSGCQEILAEGGAQVKRGEQIATVGKTGRSTGAHLHFAASKDGKYFKPVFTDEMAGTFPIPENVLTW